MTNEPPAAPTPDAPTPEPAATAQPEPAAPTPPEPAAAAPSFGAGAPPPAPPSAPPSAPPPGYAHPYAGPPGYGYPPPFAPVVREAWINPSKRSRLIWIAAAAAVVLFGAGFGIGWGAAPGGHDRVGPRIERGGYGFPGYPGNQGQFGPGRHVKLPAPQAPAAPSNSTAPSSSPTK